MHTKKSYCFLLFMLVLLSGLVSTLTGLGGSDNGGYVDGVGSLARFNNPYGVAVTSIGDVIVADSGNNNIRKVTSTGKFIYFCVFPPLRIETLVGGC